MVEEHTSSNCNRVFLFFLLINGFLILIRPKSPTSCSFRVTVLRLTLARFSSFRSHAISAAVFLISADDLRLMIPSNFLDVFRGLPLRGRSFKPYPERYLTLILFTVDLPIDNNEAISREDFPSSENLITLSRIWICVFRAMFMLRRLPMN